MGVYAYAYFLYMWFSLLLQVLDEDGNVTVVGVSPCSGRPTLREALDVPKETAAKTPLDVEAIAAGGRHVCLVLAHRTAV